MKRKWIDMAKEAPPAHGDVWGWSRSLQRATVYYIGTRPQAAAVDISHWMPRTGKAPKHSPFAALPGAKE